MTPREYKRLKRERLNEMVAYRAHLRREKAAMRQPNRKIKPIPPRVFSSIGGPWPTILACAECFGVQRKTIWVAIERKSRCLKAGGRYFWLEGSAPPVASVRYLVRSDGKRFVTITQALGMLASDPRHHSKHARITRAIKSGKPFDGHWFSWVDEPMVKQALQVA